MSRYIAPFLIVILLAGLAVHAQKSAPEGVRLKRVSDTILRHRTLTVANPFNAKRALLRLFPGKWYDLSDKGGKNHLVSWVCPACVPKVYYDANEMDTVLFPYTDGVATRLLDVFSYSDSSSGRQYKILSFNHSGYDEDGLQMDRLSGGLVGMASFVLVDSGWQLQVFQPAIAAYGSFAQAPRPRPIMVGDGQYAFFMDHTNGGPGGPYWTDSYLIAEVDGKFQQILASHRTGLTDGKAGWTYKYTVIPSQKAMFRDIEIVCKGRYPSSEPELLPAELKGKVKAGQKGSFTIKHFFVYTPKKGYVERLPAMVTMK